MLTFSDGKSGCMGDYKFFNLTFKSINSSIKEFVSGKDKFSIAMIKNPNICPVNRMDFGGGGKTFQSTSWALNKCEDSAIAAALKQNKNPQGCECEIIYNLDSSTNVPFPKSVFENKTRAWMASVQGDNQLKSQFSDEERKQNSLFLAQYLPDLGGSNKISTNKRVDSQAESKIVAEKEEALKLLKAQDEKKLQQEIAKQQQLELEQRKLAEKIKQEEDASKKAQLEKVQKELADKSRLEQERIAAEAKKVQAELDKLKSLEKDKREKPTAESQPSKLKQTSVAASSGASAQTTKSVKALVIGNSNYGTASLANPTNDAKAVAKRLAEFGFVVDQVIDGDRKQIISALTKYQKDSAKYEVNILYYAGHGIQLNGTNYLIPTDMSLAANGSNVEFDAIPVNSVIEKYMLANTKIVFLDACRDNPLSRSLISATRGSGGASRGLAPMEMGGGTLISYATKDGNVALDGDGRNSPYTEALLENINERIDISLLLRKVRKSVMAKTNGKQVPWDYGSLMTDELILSNK